MTPWIVIAAGCLMIGIAKSGFGGGLGLMVVPIVTIALASTQFGSETALGFLLPVLISGDIIALLQFRREFSLQLIKRLAIPSVIGVVVASTVLSLIKGSGNEAMVATILRLEIGIESMLLVGLHWYRTWRGVQHKMMPEPLRSRVVGGFCGISSTLAHAAAPILAAYLLPLGLDRRIFVGTSVMYFFLLNLTKVPFYYAGGIFDGTPWRQVLMMLPLVLIGAIIGTFILRRMSDKLFVNIVYTITFALGVYLIGDAVVGLLRS